MHRVLEKMAKQLNEYDEASLMHLWNHYATLVNGFEPTKRWEEATIALGLIQSIRWKNQLFNYHLAATATPAGKDTLPPLPDFFANPRGLTGKNAEPETPAKTKATILRFPEKDGKEKDGGAEQAQGNESPASGIPQTTDRTDPES